MHHRIRMAVFLELLFFTLTVTMFSVFALEPLRTAGVTFAITVFGIMSLAHSAVQIRREGIMSLVLFAVSFSLLAATWNAYGLISVF